MSANVMLENIPNTLKQIPRWMLWQYRRQGETTKKSPLSGRTYVVSSTTDSENWLPFSEIVASFQQGRGRASGLNFVCGEGVVGIDLDKCRNPDTGAIEPHAQRIVDLLDSYTEISVSGTGLHIFARGAIPSEFSVFGGVEIKDHKKTLSVTGHRISSHADVAERGQQLADLYAELAPQSGGAFSPEYMSGDVSQGFPGTDVELIRRAMGAAGGPGAAKFGRVWHGQWHSDYESQSEADLGLCSLLYWWCGPDAARIDRLFRQSHLYRSKWDERHGRGTYGEITVGKAVRNPRPTWADAAQGTLRETPAAVAVEEVDEPPPHDPETIVDAAATDRRFALTDLGNCERIVARYGERLRYVSEWGKWLLWDDRIWKPGDALEVQPLARRTVRKIYKEAAGAEEEATRKAIAAWALKSESGEKLNTMISLARADVRLPVTLLDTHPHLIAVQNGTVDLRSATIRPPDSDLYLTKQINLHYDPSASCPVFEEFLDTVMQGRQDLVDFLQLALGYSLTGDTREQCFFLCYGSGQNGKSTLLEVIAEVFNDYAMTADFTTFLHKEYETVRNDIARLRGARFVVASETDEGKRLSESVIKQITGGDKVSARFLFQETFTFRPEMKVWLGANHKPTIRGTDFAIWRRVRLIPFTRTFTPEERDPTIKDKLREELPGILAWCIRGAQRWYEHGLTTPETVQAATEEYRQEQDAVALFLEEMCTKSDTVSVSASTLFDAFQKWSGNKELTQTAFGRKLKDMGYQKSRDSITGRALWRGLFLTDQTEQQ